MKRKITSLICGLALMLTMFCVPVGAAEQVIGYDSGTILVDRLNYHFNLGVVTGSAVTEGESTGMKHMSCSMYIISGSTVYRDSDYAQMFLNITMSGYGTISEAHSTCSVDDSNEILTLIVG